MSPGRELNILIAEKVMGETVVKTKSGSKRGGYFYTLGEPHWYDIQGDMQLANPVPPYSEDIASAWLVVEKLSEEYPEVEFITKPCKGGNAFCQFIGEEVHGGYHIMHKSFGETIPHAIALAAFKAMGK